MEFSLLLKKTTALLSIFKSCVHLWQNLITWILGERRPLGYQVNLLLGYWP